MPKRKKTKAERLMDVTTPKLTEFRTALARNPEALDELSDDSFLRYARGEFPQAVKWLMRYPELLRALARDAEQQRPVEQIPS